MHCLLVKSESLSMRICIIKPAYASALWILHKTSTIDYLNSYTTYFHVNMYKLTNCVLVGHPFFSFRCLELLLMSYYALYNGELETILSGYFCFNTPFSSGYKLWLYICIWNSVLLPVWGEVGLLPHLRHWEVELKELEYFVRVVAPVFILSCANSQDQK